MPGEPAGYAASDMKKAISIAMELGEELQGAKREGMRPERTDRIRALCFRMAPYKPPFQEAIKDYLEKDKTGSGVMGAWKELLSSIPDD
jgi:hypothetical protein